MKKWLIRLLNLFSVLIIAFALIILLTVVMTRQGEAPDILGYSFFRVMTGSMEPEIPVDSLIIVKKTDPSEIKANDVISYYSTDPELNGAVNTHRVVSVEKKDNEYQFTTKGDANALADDCPAIGQNLVGKVIFSSYTLGVAVNFLSSPVGFVLLIMLPLTLILITSLYRTVKSARKIMKEEEEAAVRKAMEEIRERKRRERNGEKDGQ